MAEGGRVTSYLQRYLGSEDTTILFPGYCGHGTVGGQLLELAEVPLVQRARLSDTLRVGQKKVHKANIRATIHTLPGYSAHADRQGLLSWLFPCHPYRGPYTTGETVFITHGESRQRRGLARAIREHVGGGYIRDVHLPGEADDWFDLDAGTWVLAETEAEEDPAETGDHLEVIELRRENERLRAQLLAQQIDAAPG